MLGFGEIVVLVAVAVIVFNARRLPELGSALGKTFGYFKKGIKQGEEEDRPSRDVAEIEPPRKPKK